MVLKEKEIRPKYIFYHADRAATLKENQPIELDDNNLSYFGKCYWNIFKNKPVAEMGPAQQREYFLEQIKQETRYSLYSSRLQSIFAANTVAEAILFANSIVPKPNHVIPIFEIFAEKFWTLDSNWLDYIDAPDQFEHYRSYWDGIISNHRPEVGDRRPPRLEVLISLPASTGKIVYMVD
jgi:hypothetical protein